jgi:hypothetical protein
VNQWGNGVLEQWNDDQNIAFVKKTKYKPIIPTFHYSNIPGLL